MGGFPPPFVFNAIVPLDSNNPALTPPVGHYLDDDGEGPFDLVFPQTMNTSVIPDADDFVFGGVDGGYTVTNVSWADSTKLLFYLTGWSTLNPPITCEFLGAIDGAAPQTADMANYAAFGPLTMTTL